MTDIENLKLILRENDIPFFTDEELEYYLKEAQGDVKNAQSVDPHFVALLEHIANATHKGFHYVKNIFLRERSGHLNVICQSIQIIDFRRTRCLFEQVDVGRRFYSQSFFAHVAHYTY